MQLALTDGDRAPRFDPDITGAQRITLGRGAWLDYAPGFLSGHAALMDRLVRDVDWHRERRPMYARVVDVPRLTATLPADASIDPTIAALAAGLGRRYDASFDAIGLALYRDGRDSVAWHRDQVLRELPDGYVATVSLGAPRPFLVRPYPRGPSRSFRLGWGDLMVMGGTCQQIFEHAVPKVAHADPRIVMMFREHRRAPTR